ncbi:MAG: TolC family protein, partial [Muribaculaceae bacterium]|nr:TolC family protein [Muribaculaceae bacterium]
MKKILIVALLQCLVPHAVSAQNEWTYSDCVNYAREHNISLLKSRLGERTASLDLEGAKAQWQPTLDFATTQGYTNTPWSDGNKNAYASSYGLNAGWTLWDGGIRSNTIKRDEIAVQRARLTSDDYLRTLQTDLLQVYLNILYAKEAIGINESAVELSKAQAERAKALMESGKISRVDYAQLNSQYEQDCYNLVNSRSTYNTRVMELKQLLELGIEAENVVPVPIEWTADQVLAELPSMAETYNLKGDDYALFVTYSG